MAMPVILRPILGLGFARLPRLPLSSFLGGGHCLRTFRLRWRALGRCPLLAHGRADFGQLFHRGRMQPGQTRAHPATELPQFRFCRLKFVAHGLVGFRQQGLRQFQTPLNLHPHGVHCGGIQRGQIVIVQIQDIVLPQ